MDDRVICEGWEFIWLMIHKQQTENMQTRMSKWKRKQSRCRRKQPPGQRWTVLMNMRRKKKEHSPPWRSRTHTHLPCVSVDWVNQPNFPFFFSVRSASVTPWCYQHAVHTARQQRKQWVSTRQRERRGEEERGTSGERQLQYKLQYRHSYHVQRSYRTSVQDIEYNPLGTKKSEPGLCCPTTAKKIIQHIHF